MGYYFAAMTVRRFFYYTPFLITNGGVVACGLSYNGKAKDETHKWDKIVAVDVAGIELSNSCMEMLKCWNHQVHLWLKFYVLMRLTKPGGRPGLFANLSTFIVSAFWHGFYPSYYFTFFFAAVLSECTKDVFKSWIFFTWIPALPRHICGHLLSMFCMNYLGIVFASLTFANGFFFMEATYYSVFIFLIVFLMISRSINLVGIAAKKMKALESKDKTN
jgi:hypothetical protein